MKKLLINILIITLTLVLTILPILPIKLSAFSLSSECIVVMDIDSNKVLYSQNPNKQRLIASITKIMTAIIAIESNRLNDVVVVDEIILEAIGSNIYIEIGEELTIEQLLYGLMLRSGNDAALVISKYIGTTVEDFVTLMNEKAKEIGMLNTTFSNPHGLDHVNQNISTAYDMALLSSYASKNIDYMQIVGTSKYQTKTNYKTYVWYNKNKLLSTSYITGGKTGFTEAARRTLVSTGSQNDVNITVVTLNDGNDFANHLTMYEYIFNNYSNYKLLDKDNFYVKEDTHYTDELYINNDVYYSLTKTELSNIKNVIELEKLEFFENNTKVGTNKIYIGTNLIHEEDIYVKIKEDNDKEDTSLWGNIVKTIKNWFNND